MAVVKPTPSEVAQFDQALPDAIAAVQKEVRNMRHDLARADVATVVMTAVRKILDSPVGAAQSPGFAVVAVYMLATGVSPVGEL